MDCQSWSSEKINRRIDQEYEMAALARQDGDKIDAKRRYTLIEELKAELRSR